MLVGHALLAGRAVARSNARRGSYPGAFNAWRPEHHFNLNGTDRCKLLAAMAVLSHIEAWRATLPDKERARMNYPSTVLVNYRKAMAIGVRPRQPYRGVDVTEGWARGKESEP